MEETYSIPIYEDGVETEWTIDGIVGDEEYQLLLNLGMVNLFPQWLMLKLKVKNQRNLMAAESKNETDIYIWILEDLIPSCRTSQHLDVIDKIINQFKLFYPNISTFTLERSVLNLRKKIISDIIIFKW